MSLAARVPAWVRGPGAPAAAAVGLAAGGGLLLLYVARVGVDSYRGYLALGRGGLPYNVWGWMIQGAMQLVARHDTISTAPFRSAGERARYGPAGQTLFTADAGLPAREGPRPTVPGYVAPQRQTTAPASSVTVVAMADYLDGLARANAHALTVRPSALEGVHADALWLADAMPVPAPMAATTRGEICHVHRSDGSSHMTLSLADADAAVAKGWAERHRLSGASPALPLRNWPWPVSYVLVYAPRSDAELAVWKTLVMASLHFVCAGTADLKDV